MAIDYVRNIISSGYNLSKINDNFVKIEEALQDGLSRSGNGPNQMSADLDMNSNDILNIKTLQVQDLTIDGTDPTGILERASNAVTEAEEQADIATAAAISVQDLYDDVAALAAATPPITANTMLVDNATGTARENKTFAEVRALAELPEPALTRTALKAIDTTKQKYVYLRETGREGLFTFRTGNFSSLVSLDTAEGLWIKADAIAASSGAWVRQGEWAAYGALLQWFGVVFDGVTDNATALIAAINTIKATVKRARFSYGICVTSAGINLFGATGVVLEGTSGGPTGGAAPGSILRFTNTGNGITCGASAGVVIRDLYLQNNNASWTGTLVQANSSAGNSDTAFLTIERCTFNAATVAGGEFINMDRNICVRIDNCNFVGAQRQIRGAASGSYCNVVTIKSCHFVGYGINPIVSGAGDGWLIEGCTFEQASNGTASAIVGTVYALTMTGNYFGDATSSGYWVDLTNAAGFVFSGNTITGANNTGATQAIRFTTTAHGFSITGNKFSRFNVAVYTGATSSFDHGVIEGNFFQNCATAVYYNATNQPNTRVAGNYVA